MLTPINLKRFRKWAVKMLYYDLFELIAEDFMGKKDCKIVHTPGNIIAPTSGGPCTQAIPGGTSIVINGLKPIYKARAQLGDLQIDVAEEIGEFTG